MARQLQARGRPDSRTWLEQVRLSFRSLLVGVEGSARVGQDGAPRGSFVGSEAEGEARDGDQLEATAVA